MAKKKAAKKRKKPTHPPAVLDFINHVLAEWNRFVGRSHSPLDPQRMPAEVRLLV